jgi:hypothetical protein
MIGNGLIDRDEPLKIRLWWFSRDRGGPCQGNSPNLSEVSEHLKRGDLHDSNMIAGRLSLNLLFSPPKSMVINAALFFFFSSVIIAAYDRFHLMALMVRDQLLQESRVLFCPPICFRECTWSPDSAKTSNWSRTQSIGEN